MTHISKSIAFSFKGNPITPIKGRKTWWRGSNHLWSVPFVWESSQSFIIRSYCTNPVILVYSSRTWILGLGVIPCEFLLSCFLKIIYLNCGERYEFMIDHRSYTHHLSSCEIRAGKKIPSWREFEPRTSAIPMQCSGHFVSS